MIDSRCMADCYPPAAVGEGRGVLTIDDFFYDI